MQIQDRRTRSGEDPGLALPLPRRQIELAAAGKLSGTAVVTVILPDAQARLTLHRERQGGYLIELERTAHANTVLVIAVRYGMENGGEGFVMVPVRQSGLAHLEGFSPTFPWQMVLMAPAHIPALGAESVVSSIHAAANNATKRAWREISSITPEIRNVIEGELGEPTNASWRAEDGCCRAGRGEPAR